MSDSALILEIRQIESSPSGHQPFAIRMEIQAHLAALRAEAVRRGLVR